MALDVWFKENIANGINATVGTVIDTAKAHNSINIEFVLGVFALARSQATLYGLDWQEMLSDIQKQAQLDAGIFDLLKDVNK